MFRTGDDVRLRGHQSGQDGHCSAEKERSAAAGGNVLVGAGAETEEVAEFIMSPAEPGRRSGTLETTHGPAPAFDATAILFKPVVIGHNFGDATGGLGETSRRLYPGATGTGASGAREVGRPPYLMSCELALLSGRPCDQPGCAVSANP